MVVQLAEVHIEKGLAELYSAIWAAVKGPAIAPVWQSPDLHCPDAHKLASNKATSEQIFALTVFSPYFEGTG
jgi:hypothetical protein